MTLDNPGSVNCDATAFGYVYKDVNGNLHRTKGEAEAVRKSPVDGVSPTSPGKETT